MIWRKIHDKGYNSNITINLRKILNKMYKKPEFNKTIYSMEIDYKKKTITIKLKKRK